jgi:hypothetical protein
MRDPLHLFEPRPLGLDSLFHVAQRREISDFAATPVTDGIAGPLHRDRRTC